MKTVVLGKASPLTVSAVGLGCMGMVSALSLIHISEPTRP